MVSRQTSHYPYTKTWEEAKYDDVLIVHTSGSTGASKPTYYNHTHLNRSDMDSVLPSVPGRRNTNLSLLGPLSQATGDLITTRTNAHLWQILGSTETHLYPLLLHPAAHWKHLDSHPTCVPTVTIVPGALAADQSQLYVIVQDRKADSEAGGAFQPVFDMFPSLTQSRFRDLVKKIQVEGGRTLFSYQGHIDDLLIFSNGLKVNPLNIETEVSGHILLSGSLVFGAESRECALLLERKTGRCGMK
ncbi:hypothetical protein IMSHALPRED_001361 [Imshaugia aleurites]|uniref:AMP-dependent synthetase/ligase domain-containing protein n=1 Tax=Imshaugia aleurites TaxID=172621 RepID=A0A8H3J2P5_9LECA|nr:hypothetical protein IMSHALPRED_001361 [Imshaugia aleurites]